MGSGFSAGSDSLLAFGNVRFLDKNSLHFYTIFFIDYTDEFLVSFKIIIAMDKLSVKFNVRVIDLLDIRNSSVNLGLGNLFSARHASVKQAS